MGLFNNFLKARKPSSQANLLRAEGTPALGTLNNDGGKRKPLNPVGFYNPDVDKYMTLWTNYDLNQCVARYVWEDLPNGLTSWNLERMLYFRGSLVGFNFAGKIYILPYAIKGNINPYGLPVEVMPISYNGNAPGGKTTFFGKGFKLPVDNNADQYEQYNAVLLYDSVPYNAVSKSPSRYFMNQIIIDEIASTMARININVVVSNKKILLVIKDAKQADVVRGELETAFGTDSPFGIITSPLDTQSVQSTSDFDADKLIAIMKNYDAIRKIMSGIMANYGTDKGERLVTGELQGNEENVSLILDMGLELRELWAEQMNANFGTTIKVRKRADDYKQEVNGNGNTEEDEEKELNE